MIIDKERGLVAAVWGVDDVRKVVAQKKIRFKKGMNLTNDDCFKVLNKAVTNHDTEQGINTDVLEFWITALFRSRIIN